MNNQIALSDQQKLVADGIFLYASRLDARVNLTTDAECDALDNDIDVAVSEIWSDFSDLRTYVLYNKTSMYILPTVTSENFNLIAMSTLEELKLLMVKYQLYYRRNFDHDLHEINWQLGKLQEWHNRLLARCEDVATATRGVPLGGLNEDVWVKIVKNIAADIQL